MIRYHTNKCRRDKLYRGREPEDVDVAPIPSTPAATSNVCRGLAMNTPVSQLLPLSKYIGNSNTETFKEWHEQIQLVTTVCKWEDRLTLANLATQLQGQACTFYHTCSQQQKHLMKAWCQSHPRNSSQSGSRLYKVVSFPVVNKDCQKELMIMLRTLGICIKSLPVDQLREQED